MYFHSYDTQDMPTKRYSYMTNVEISSLTVVVPWRETHPVGMHNKAKVNLMTKFMCIVWCDGRSKLIFVMM